MENLTSGFISDVRRSDISPSTSRIIAWVTEDIIAWRNRSLKRIHLTVWTNGIAFKVRETIKVINKTAHIAVGLRRDEYKEVWAYGWAIGFSDNRMRVLTDKKARGLKDILITASDR